MQQVKIEAVSLEEQKSSDVPLQIQTKQTDPSSRAVNVASSVSAVLASRWSDGMLANETIVTKNSVVLDPMAVEATVPNSGAQSLACKSS